MIRYLENRAIDRKKWDEAIDRSFNGMIYAYSWYLDIVAGEWDALVEDEYRKVFPLVTRKKMGIRYLYQPPFCQQLGLFSADLITPDCVTGFLDAIPEQFRFAEINLNSLNKAGASWFEAVPFVNHELDLIQPYEDLAKKYSTNLKRNLKNAEKSGISVLPAGKPEEVVHLFRNNRGKEIGRVAGDHYQRLLRLIYLLMYKNMARVYTAWLPDNSPGAGAFFVTSHNRSIFLFSGTAREARNTGALAALIDRFIKDHAQQHRVLDFEGSNDPDLARFYQGFGTRRVTYPHVRFDRLPAVYSLLVKMKKKIR